MECGVLFSLILLAGGESEAEIKAAFLFQFANYVEWPADTLGGPAEPFRVAVVGAPGFADVLEKTLAGRQAAGRGFSVVRAEKADDALRCHIVYAPGGEALRRPGLLAVGDGERFAAGGGTVGFQVENRRVRLVLNPAAADQAGLKLSAKLLQVGRVVREP